MAKRRSKGDGGIEVLKSGKFKAVVCRTVNGKRVRSSKVFDLKADAQAFLRAGAETGPTAPLTLAAWVALWLPLHEGRVAAKTYKGDKWAVDTYILAHGIARTKLRDLDSVAVETHLTGLDVSGSERHKAAKVLRNILNAAVRAKKLPASPMGGPGGAKMPKKPKPAAESLSPADLRTLLDTADTEGHGPLIRLWVDTGMRPGELLGLKWKDFDPTAGTVKVDRAICRVTNELKDPKTEAGRRVLALSPSTVAALRTMTRGANEAPLFHPAGGGQLHWWPDNFSTCVFRPLVKRAGLKKCKPYMLRHTCATLLIRAGVSLKVVSQRLGHEDVALTLSTYAHCLPDDQHRAAAAWELVLEGLPSSPYDIPTAGKEGTGGRGRKR